MDRGVSYHDRDGDTCPFFAGSTAAAASRTCLAGDKAVTVSGRYVESYCVRSLHVTCSLYVAAREESSDATARHPQDAPATALPDTATVEPAQTSEMPAIVAAPMPQSAPTEAADQADITDGEDNRRRFGRVALMRWAVGGLVVVLLVALALNTRRGEQADPGTLGAAKNGAGMPAATATRAARDIAVSTVNAAIPAVTEGSQPTMMIRVAPTRAVPTSTPLVRALVTDTPTRPPTATPTQESAALPTPRVTDTLRPAPRVSGIGLARARWEAAHGAAGNEVGGLSYYEGGRYLVGYTGGKVVSITREWGVQQGVRIQTARARARALLPEDAVIARTETLGENLTVELYTSRSLRRVFPPTSGDSWTGRDRGAASVVYRQTGGLVDSVTVFVGELEAET